MFKKINLINFKQNKKIKQKSINILNCIKDRDVKNLFFLLKLHFFKQIEVPNQSFYVHSQNLFFKNFLKSV